MTHGADQLLNEVDSGLAALASGNRTVDLRMVEFLLELDQKVTDLLEQCVPAKEHKQALAKIASLEKQRVSLESDLKDAVADGEGWERACLKIHHQVMDLVGMQSATSEAMLARLTASRDSLPTEPPSTAMRSLDSIPAPEDLPDLDDPLDTPAADKSDNGDAAEPPADTDEINSEKRWDSPET